MAPGPYQQTLGFLLNDTSRLLRKRFEQRARIELEPITLGRIVDRLEAAELIQRRRHETDRRAWRLFLEPKAHDLLAHMFVIGDATRTEALEGVSEADRVVLTRVLSRMKSNLIAACETPAGEAEPMKEAVNG